MRACFYCRVKLSFGRVGATVVFVLLLVVQGGPNREQLRSVCVSERLGGLCLLGSQFVLEYGCGVCREAIINGVHVLPRQFFMQLRGSGGGSAVDTRISENGNYQRGDLDCLF